MARAEPARLAMQHQSLLAVDLPSENDPVIRTDFACDKSGRSSLDPVHG